VALPRFVLSLFCLFQIRVLSGPHLVFAEVKIALLKIKQFFFVNLHDNFRRAYNFEAVAYVTNFARKRPQENVRAERIMNEVDNCGLLHKEEHCNWITVQVN
jgi:hypothetical protein